MRLIQMPLIIEFCIPFNYSHGTQKLLTGAALVAVGKITNSQNLQETGGALVGLGVATNIGAHFFR